MKMLPLSVLFLALAVQAANGTAKDAKSDDLIGERVSLSDPKASLCPPKSWPASRLKMGLASFDLPGTKLLFAGLAAFKWNDKTSDYKKAVTDLVNEYMREDKATLAKKEELQLDSVKGMQLSFTVPRGKYVAVDAVRVIVMLENGYRLWFNVPADQYAKLEPSIKASIASFKKE